MKVFSSDLLKVTAGLVALYLIVVHYTGFSRAVAAGGRAYTGGVKALQGR